LRHHLFHLACVFHQLPHLIEALKQIVHFRYRAAAAARDPLTAARI